MKQSRTKLAGLIADKTLHQGLSRELSEEIAAYLLTENRTAELNSVLRDVQAEWAARGFVEVLAYSAHPLSDKTKQDIKAHVSRLYPEVQNVRITELQDPEVVGGVRLELPHQQLDLTVEAKLDRFKQLTSAGKDV